MLGPHIGNRLGRNLDSPKDIVGQTGLQCCREAAIVRALDPKGARIFLPSYIHAPIAFIFEANLAGAIAGCDSKRGRQSFGERFFKKLDAERGTVDGEIVGCGNIELSAKLKGAVLYQLCVYATVARVVDILVTVS